MPLFKIKELSCTDRFSHFLSLIIYNVKTIREQVMKPVINIHCTSAFYYSTSHEYGRHSGWDSGSGFIVGIPWCAPKRVRFGLCSSACDAAYDVAKDEMH